MLGAQRFDFRVKASDAEEAAMQEKAKLADSLELGALHRKPFPESFFKKENPTYKGDGNLKAVM